jgi:hypothetical protein
VKGKARKLLKIGGMESFLLLNKKKVPGRGLMVLQLIRTVHKNIVVQANRDTRHSHTTSTLQSIQMASRLFKNAKLVRLNPE